MTRAIRASKLSELLREVAEGALPVAGCTDVMVVDQISGQHAKRVVDLSSVPELRGISADGAFLDIGAAESFRSIASHPRVQQHAPALAAAARTIGSWQIQNRATLGGNIANASPAGDSLPVLLALDARIVVAGRDGFRSIPHDEMHLGYRRTALHPSEVIVRVQLPLPSPRIQLYRKIGTRQAQAISKVVLALGANLQGGSIASLRIGAGSVAPTPMRLREAEAAALSKTPRAGAAEAAAAAGAEISPQDDLRSTARYRRHVLESVLRRMILSLNEGQR